MSRQVLFPLPLPFLEPNIRIFRKAVGASRAIAVVFSFNMVVACTMTHDPPAQIFGDPIEGV
jgi:hypothetical protein